MSAIFSDISGVILAGGQSKRFGEDKAFAQLDGVPLIYRVLKAIKYLFPEILLITNSPDQFRFFPAKVIRDDIPQQGPLGGIVTALDKAKHDRVFVVACDMPQINPPAIRTVIENSNGCEAAVPVHGERYEYLMALYTRSLLMPMREALSNGHLSLKEFLNEREGIAWVPVEGESCFNVNTKKDLADLESHNVV